MVTAATQNFDINVLLLPLGPAPVAFFDAFPSSDITDYTLAETLRAAYPDDENEEDEEEDDEDEDDDFDEDEDEDFEDDDEDEDEDEDDEEEPSYQVYDDDDEDEEEVGEAHGFLSSIVPAPATPRARPRPEIGRSLRAGRRGKQCLGRLLR